MDIFSFLIPASLIAVALVLAFGIYALFRGGDYGRSRSNKLMRLRVVMQAIAIVVLMTAVWWRSQA
jgi:hypothetical protein